MASTTAPPEMGVGKVSQLRPRRVLTGLRFEDVVAESVQLSQARLTDCEFRGSVLIGADLRDAILTRVRFVDCHLAGAQFENTKLDDVSFVNCNLSGSRFRETRMDGVELDRVDRRGWRCDQGLWHRFPGYEVEKLLGGGRFGRTYRARRRSRVRPVALKVYGESGDDGAALRDLVVNDKGPLGKRLRSKHVARVVDFGVAGKADHVYLATEYLEGETLAEMIRGDSWRSVPEAARIRLFREMAAGLAAIHGNNGSSYRAASGEGPAHADIKPSNVFLAREGRGRRQTAKLIDIGVSADESSPGGELTRSGLKRMAYDPPEVVFGGMARGPSADVYALGITLLEAFCGSHPYAGRLETVGPERPDGTVLRADVVRMLNQAIPQLPYDEVTPSRLRPVLRRCTQVVSKFRYQDGRELYEALQSIGD